MSNEIYYAKGFNELKAEIKEELSKSVNSFVRIGYLLKVARDTNVLAESPYSNMEEFAYAEFKIDKGTASKFMSINDRFSEGGCSDHLKPEYNGIGWSKLTLMLQLPDSINEEITNGFSKSEIQTIKDEVEEANKVTPIETILEGETSTTEVVDTVIEKAIRQLAESEPQMYSDMYEVWMKDNGNFEERMKRIKAVMAPSGENIYSIRILGVGRIMLSVKDYEERVAVINERTGKKINLAWDILGACWWDLMNEGGAEASYEKEFKKEFPKKAEVAPVQPVKPVQETKKEVKKVKKVNEPKKNVTKMQESDSKKQIPLHAIDDKIPLPSPIEPEKESVEEENTVAAVQEEHEEQLPGQTSIENDMPEVLPDSVTTRCEEDHAVRGYKAAVKNKLNRMTELWESEDSVKKMKLMLETLDGMKFDLEMIIEKMEEE